jgi:hypothetical protein
MVVPKRNRESVLDVVIRCVPSEGVCFWGVVREFDWARNGALQNPFRLSMLKWTPHIIW